MNETTMSKNNINAAITTKKDRQLQLYELYTKKYDDHHNGDDKNTKEKERKTNSKTHTHTHDYNVIWSATR